MHEVPLLALAERKDVAEQLLGLGAVEEVLLVGRTLIGVTRRRAFAALIAETARSNTPFCDTALS